VEMDEIKKNELTPSPPAQSGFAQRCALSVSLSPLAEFGSTSTSPATSARRWVRRRSAWRRRMQR
jgi:hypothetical protein